MTITLLTAVPRTGKTSYAVWDIIRPAVETGKHVYVYGIPKLKLPHIKVNEEWLRNWHHRTYDDEIEEDRLLNIPPNSLIVIDEAWQVWPAAGLKNISEDISHLAKHGHYGIDFLIITQKPHLLHTGVLAQVSVHKHILKKWSGLKMLEWPEYCQNPTARTNRDNAVTVPFQVRKESFDLYHSGQHHGKLKQRKPLQLYASFALFLALPILLYTSYQVVAGKGEQNTETETAKVAEIEPTESITALPIQIPETITSDSEPQIKETTRILPTVLSNQYDWDRIAACLDSKSNGCVCYGQSAERLMIPLETCQLAARHGWTQAKKNNKKKHSSL